jgi:hypothetical protein
LHSTAETEHQVEGRLLLDVVIGQGAPVLQLLAGKDQALLVGRDAASLDQLGRVENTRRMLLTPLCPGS